MSSRLSRAQSPAHVEIIGLNAFTASSAPQHQVSIGIWGAGQMTGQQCREKKKKEEKGKQTQKEIKGGEGGGLLLQCKMKHDLK